MPSAPPSPRGRQAEREEKEAAPSSSSSPKDRDLRAGRAPPPAPPARSLPKKDAAVRSDRDLYNDLLEEATTTQHTCSTSNSSLEYDGNGSSRFSAIDLDLPDLAASANPSRTNRSTVIVDAQQQSRPRSPGHTGHERRQKFTFVGEILDDNDDDEDMDGADEFGEEDEGGVDFAAPPLPSPTTAPDSLTKPKAVRPGQPKKPAPTKPKKKASAARCDAV